HRRTAAEDRPRPGRAGGTRGTRTARRTPHAAVPAAVDRATAGRRRRDSRRRRRVRRLERHVSPDASGKPERDCPLCPRLKGLRDDWRRREPDWFNAPVDSFGPATARLLIVGLAPGLRGANRTGRPFTGDYAGDLLYSTLAQFGFARGHYDARPDDGLALVDA